MRSHKPAYSLSKERDYVMCESRSFFSDLKMFTEFLRPQLTHPTARTLLAELVVATEAHDLRPLRGLCERARTFAWDTMRTPAANEGALMLSFFTWVSSFMNVWSKEPADYDKKLRPKGTGPIAR